MRGGGATSVSGKLGGLQVIVSGLESGGGRPKVRTESEGQAFSKCFPKKGKEQNHSSAPPFSRFWKWGICPFTSSPYAMEMMFKLIYMNSI